MVSVLLGERGNSDFLCGLGAHVLVRSLVLADVDLGGLSKIELLICGFLHQVEHCVLQDELHQFHEGLLHEHSLAE